MASTGHNNTQAHADTEKRAEQKANVVRQLKTLLTMINVFLQRVKSMPPQSVAPKRKTTKGG